MAKTSVIIPARNEAYLIPYVHGRVGYVYVITNQINDKQYVGQTMLPLSRRWTGHKVDAGRKVQTALYSAMNKYGLENFSIKAICVLDSCELKGHMDAVETYWIKALNTLAPNGYNLISKGRGGPISAEHKEKLRLAHIGKKASPATRAKMSAAQKGRKMPSWFGEMMSVRNQGNTYGVGKKKTPELLAMISAVHKGKVLSTETKAKISASVRRQIQEKKLGEN